MTKGKGRKEKKKKALIYTTEFLEAPLYCPITCIPISLCSFDIGNSLEGIVTEFELIQHK